MTITMTWVHAYAEWVESKQEYEEALRECQEGRSFFPDDLAELEYQAAQSTILAYGAIETQQDIKHIKIQLQSLAEFAVSSPEYMDLPPNSELVRELRRAKKI